MLVYYATLRQFMRIPMGVIMRTAKGVKKSVNVSLAPEILEEARRLNINLSAVLTGALQEKFREAQRMAWLEENRSAIDAVNQWVDENGSFSDFQRSF
ncbi:TPA: type II toxin-antitoxin system CcdA family antitoxin [Enterobacter cancerogenus]|uniref:type II toxin-antitoxin system CcdA family antitoxin n=1 Tax=Enterobacter sp. TaxID=42895 RepID=UPI0032FBD91D|nr:type II toxin-antitoxin system CcdA family antitoxin [Enterobacter cancerogenus]HDR2163458.1 type II toxin-antitoxin system CcdA family antitoxin [Enterobacter cancerogenus]HDR2266084.1 type II toxin-antitoxin system CcdA family antitoxin [Enterobacter cancerogenus]